MGAIRASIERTARAVSARADEIAQARQNLDVPILTPTEAREATMRYAFGAALGGWVTAIALDLLPLLLLAPVIFRFSGSFAIRAQQRDPASAESLPSLRLRTAVRSAAGDELFDR